MKLKSPSPALFLSNIGNFKTPFHRSQSLFHPLFLPLLPTAMTPTNILETALYVTDLSAASAFYQHLFNLPVLAEDERFCALDVGGKSVLLLFVQGGSTHETHLPDGVIPHHDGKGPVHFAFGIAAADLPAWEAKLAAAEIPIEGWANWSRGGKSIFFRDLDQHLVELATPGIWAIY